MIQTAWNSRYAMIVALAICIASGSLSAQISSAEKLTLVSPIGGGVYSPGDTVIVHWNNTKGSGSGSGDSVVIELSKDGGAHWETESSMLGWRDTIAQWIVPNTTCTECLLRVRQVVGDFGGGNILDSIEIPELADKGKFNVLLSQSSKLMAVRSGANLYVIDIEKREFLHKLSLIDTARGREYDQLHFSWNDSIIVVGSTLIYDSTSIDVWNLYTGQLISSLHGREHFEPIQGVDEYDHSGAIHPTKPHVVVSGAYNPVVWDLESRTVIDTIMVQSNSQSGYLPSRSAEYSPDGSKIVVGTAGSLGTGSVYVWDVAGEEVLLQVEGDASVVQFTNDGRYLLVYSDSSKTKDKVIDAETGEVVFESDTRGSSYMALSEDAKRVQMGYRVFQHDKQRVLYYYDLRLPAKNYVQYAMFPSGDTAVGLARSGKIYWIDIAQPPTAQTANIFAISGTLPVVANQFVGSVEVGKSSDTVMSSYVVNGGNAEIEIEAIAIVSGHTNDFAILSGNNPYTLSSGQSAPLGLRFMPSDSGLRSAVLEVRTNFGVVEAELFGFGTKNSTSVEERESDHHNSSLLRMSVHPNPASDDVTIQYSLNKVSTLELLVFDMAGRIIDDIEIPERETGTHEVGYNTQELREGVYRVELRSDSQTVGRTLIIVR